MSNGQYLKKKKKKLPVWLILVLIVIMAAVAVMFFGKSPDMSPTEPDGEVNIQGDKGETNEQGTDIQTEQSHEDDETATEMQQPTESQDEQEEETQPTAVIVQRADAEYEKWLSAAMVVCVSMEYPDFQLEGLYTTSSTALEEKYDSDGVYIVFTSADTRIAIHAEALEAERTEAGTVDISTEVIGYATYDKVNPESIDFASMETINVEDLNELIAQSMLVSIYSR